MESIFLTNKFNKIGSSQTEFYRIYPITGCSVADTVSFRPEAPEPRRVPIEGKTTVRTQWVVPCIKIESTFKEFKGYSDESDLETTTNLKAKNLFR